MICLLLISQNVDDLAEATCLFSTYLLVKNGYSHILSLLLVLGEGMVGMALTDERLRLLLGDGGAIPLTGP